MARIKKGDIFSSKLDNFSKKYFQYIANDLAQLNSDVIRVFKKTYPINANPDLSEVVKDEIYFYAHCVIKWGIKLGYWEKVGNIPEIGKIDVLFRNTNDYGQILGEKPINISNNWYVWKINDKAFRQVGRLVGENINAEIGIVVTAESIVHRMRTGKYDFVYPGYENIDL